MLALADSWACTNPSLGRGASIGMLHVCALRDVIREVDLEPGTRDALVRRFEIIEEMSDAGSRSYLEDSDFLEVRRCGSATRACGTRRIAATTRRGWLWPKFSAEYPLRQSR